MSLDVKYDNKSVNRKIFIHLFDVEFRFLLGIRYPSLLFSIPQKVRASSILLSLFLTWLEVTMMTVDDDFFGF